MVEKSSDKKIMTREEDSGSTAATSDFAKSKSNQASTGYDEKKLHVHFDEAAVLRQTSTVSGIRQRKNDPRRTVVGKSNIIRDLSIFIAIVGILLGITLTPDSERRKAQKRERAEQKAMREKQKASRQRKSHAFVEGIRRRSLCQVYLSDSSVAGSGLGLFAGKDYEEGELVIGTEILLRTVGESDLYFSSQALLLKHHHLLANLAGTAVSDSTDPKEYSFTASRPITAGEELFLSFGQHPHALVPELGMDQYLLTESDYAIADEILNDLRQSVRRMEVAVLHKNTKVRVNFDYTYSLARKMVGRFNPRIVPLIPSKRALDDYGKMPVALAGMRNKTLHKLQVEQKCVTDVKIDSLEGEGGRSKMMIAARDMVENEIAAYVPLFFAEEGVKPFSDAFCREIVGKGVICPLMPLNFLQSSSEVGHVNVKYDWEVSAFKGKSFEEIANSPPGRFAIKLIATKNITSGEKVCSKKAAP